MNWDLVLAGFGIVLGSNVTVEVVKYIFKRETPERLMLKALGGDALYKWLCEWKHSEDRPASEWENIDNLYTGYKALGGNGEITKLYEECKDIKTTD